MGGALARKHVRFAHVLPLGRRVGDPEHLEREQERGAHHQHARTRAELEQDHEEDADGERGEGRVEAPEAHGDVQQAGGDTAVQGAGVIHVLPGQSQADYGAPLRVLLQLGTQLLKKAGYGTGNSLTLILIHG